MNIGSQMKREKMKSECSIYEMREKKDNTKLDSVSDIKLQIGVDEHCDIEVNDGDDGINGHQNDEPK